ncbi:MAG TPA: endonuclease III [Spirochaetia bacterium]|nr:endonuclease III [Spirochaetia bacterium]
MSSSEKERSDRALEIMALLSQEYPDARSLLEYRNPFELLVATILAAQCTDERVNQVTRTLFDRLPDPRSMAGARTEELEEIIRSTGFFHAKAKSLLGVARDLVSRFQGDVPRRIEELISLPGVGRKTANVVAGNCFNVPAVIVDTHLKRVVGRLALTEEENPDKIEFSLREIVPEDRQTRFSHVVNFHGRYRCKARKPDCPTCPIDRLCPYPDKTG